MVRNSISVKIVAFGLVLITAVFWLASCKPSTNTNSTNTNTTVNANTTAKVCDASTNSGIEADFQKSLEADSVLAPQMPHINYYSINCVLYLQGWANNFTDFKKVLKIASATTNVVTVNFDEFWDAPGHFEQPPPGDQCGPGLKQCGDFCIPEGDKCSIKGGMDSKTSTSKR